MNPFIAHQARAPHLAAVAPYTPIPAVTYQPAVLKLDLNESPLPPSPRVLEAVQTALSQPALLNWYPDPTCTALRAAISGYTGLPADHILVTNGSNQAMEVIARAYLAPADKVLVAAPVYGVFRLQAQLSQALPEEFYFQDPFAPRISELLQHHSRCKAIFIANPNNPTGAGLSRTDIKAVLETHPSALLVLDEAYAEFHDQSCADLVAKHPNLLVLRSFSKAFALAGIRCGYVLGQPDTLAPLSQVFPPWSVSALTQVAASAAVQDTDYLRQLVGECAIARQRMVDGLRALGYTARNTAANFILWQVPNPSAVQQKLATRGIYVSNKDNVRQLAGYLRVTAGTCPQAEAFLAAVRGL